MSKAIENKIAALVTDDMSAAGYVLVRVHVSGNGKYAALQIMAERLDGDGMTVDDCSTISRAVAARLALETDLADRYDLEISSPGIDRPLVRLQDYVRFQGHIAKVELHESVQGQKRFKAKIAHVSDQEVEFGIDNEKVTVAFAAIERAQLVLTSELLKATAQSGVKH